MKVIPTSTSVPEIRASQNFARLAGGGPLNVRDERVGEKPSHLSGEGRFQHVL